MTILSGVFPVVPTPFTADGSIDPSALQPLIEFVITSGANGLVYPGMASEVETLSPEERLTLVQAVGAALNGRLPFIVGASDADPGRVAARAEEGRAVGAVGFDGRGQVDAGRPEWDEPGDSGVFGGDPGVRAYDGEAE